MDDIAVVYKSKYGATGRYAQWIAEGLDCPIYEVKEITSAILEKYRAIIYGGGLYMGKIAGVSAITRRFAELKGKRLLVFTVGLTEPGDDGYFTYLITRNFTEKMRKRIAFFALPGAVDGEKLTGFDRFVMKMVMKDRAKNDPANAEAYEKLKMDFVQKELVLPIIDRAKGILDEWEQDRQQREDQRRRALEEAEAEEEGTEATEK